MSKEIEIKYFLNGVETKKEAIDWDTTIGITIKNGNEAHIIEKPSCGMSTRHKACNTRYPRTAPKFLSQGDIDEVNNLFGSLVFNKRTSSADELLRPKANLLIENENFDNAMWEKQEEMVTPAIPYLKTTSTPTGVKHNKHKAPLDIVQTRQFPKALQALALATAFGNKKYEATDKDFLNFKRVPGGSQTYFDAAARHNADRTTKDDESKLPHVIHAVWSMLAGLEMFIEEQGIDIKEYSKTYLEYLHNSK